ncbi:DsbE family thiol:disulfide interchange protein [Aquabacterium sp. A7-Y]|uniref:DsbE family thiol:disulfide interchange protein n=1 Tax=Aquabacterium sp. A7-Y TaxID=1349605 RepID=UPI00223C99C0|nr:DsbE family thiol:disulfide interchange protein [Aquabacterium sp. A7-Y]MCW7540893.1 DsbE family thiol:disulfide interchange protein [Aquabacterium sp. A7-Y]
MRWRYALPLLVLAALLLLFAQGLRQDPRSLPSALLGRPAPSFVAPVLAAPGETLSSEALRGGPWVLNVWASWCVACREEHATLLDLARRQVPLYGLNYKDAPAAARAWVAGSGDPYRRSVVDADGRIGMDFGVYGVPETFVIDRSGVVRYRHAGPLTRERVERELLPLLERLKS